MPPPSVVLFDLDGTLVDHDTALREGLIGWLTSQRLATGEECLEQLVQVWDDVAERHFPAFRARDISFQEQRRRRLRDFLPQVGIDAGRLSEESLDRTFEDCLHHYEAAWRPFDDAAPCLEALAHLRLAVLSNGDQAQQEDKLRRTHLAHHVEVVMTSSSLGASKPDPQAFALACRRLGVDPATVVYVGDRLDVDARPATAAGLRGVWLDRQGTACAEYRPTIASLADLAGTLG
ncbi:HAD family hydrolase [Pseudokineococcus basanitobsidens]|uniref:HAD family hydrolase n=1 Tax=Pseudokineococcus basanitobsidens TaxID=1926649 RepID=A0ABU8RHH3_9ACTN